MEETEGVLEHYWEEKKSSELPCWRCGEPNHGTNACKNEARCKLCRDRSYKNSGHLLGAKTCTTLRLKRRQVIDATVKDLGKK